LARRRNHRGHKNSPKDLREIFLGANSLLQEAQRSKTKTHQPCDRQDNFRISGSEDLGAQAIGFLFAIVGESSI
jgi:hypothetical protein